MSFYAPLGFLALLAIIPILIIYILKPKREDYRISSLKLWQEALKDIESSVPWQKLKKNLLMFLQILFAALTAATLAQPFINGITDSGEIILIINNSFTMQASDVEKSRFEKARQTAAEYVKNLSPGTPVTLIEANKKAVLLENKSVDKNSIINNINGIKVTNAGFDPENVKKLVLPLINNEPETKVVLISDVFFEIEVADMEFYGINGSGDNVAITLFSSSVSKNGFTALCRVANYSSGSISAPVSIYADGKLFDTKEITVSQDEPTDIYFENIPPDVTILEARLDTKDFLQADNTAWNIPSHNSSKKVLLTTESNIFLEKALSVMSGIELYKMKNFDNLQNIKGYDLYIFDGVFPETLPDDGNIMVFNPYPNNYFENSEEVFPKTVEISESDIFAYAKDFDFSVGKTKILKTPLWGEKIMYCEQGAMAFSGILTGKKIIVFGFDIHNTDLPLTSAFPILLSNSVQWLLPDAINNIKNAYPMEDIFFNFKPGANEAYVLTPSNKKIKIAPPFSLKSFGQTDETGVYTLLQSLNTNEVIHLFAINPPSSQSDIRDMGTYRPTSGEAVSIEHSKSTSKNLLFVFLIGALFVLIIEWQVYIHAS